MNLACSTCPVKENAACAVLTPEERDAMAAAGRTRTLSLLSPREAERERVGRGLASTFRPA